MKKNPSALKISPESKIVFGFVVILALFLLVAFLFYSNTRKFLETNRRVEHTHQVIEELEQTMSILKDAETGQRGFVISGNEHFLEHYNQAIDKIRPQFDKVRQLTVDNLRQQQRLDRLNPALEVKLDFLRNVVEIRKKGDFETARSLISTGKGETEMDTIRAIVGEMKEEERVLLEERTKALNASGFNALVATVSFSSVVLVSFFIGFFIIRRDIAERTRAEAGQARLISVLESSEDLIGITDVNGKIIYVNKAGQKMIGVSEETDLHQTSIPDLYPQQTRELIDREGIPTAIKKGSWLGESLFISRDGREVPVSQLIHAHKNADGKVEFLSTVARDITNRKQNEQARKESENRFRILTEKSLGLICTHKLDGTLLSVNLSGAEALGYLPSEMIGKSLKDFLTSEGKEQFQTYLDEILRKNEVSGVMHTLTKSGDYRVWQYSNVLYKEGVDEYVLGYALDVSDLKRLEEELKEARDAALDSTRLKSEFLANMSHEIRTPMNGVIGMTDLLLDIEQDKTKRGYVETIKMSADALLTIINDILDFSKIEAGKMQIETIDFDLRSTVESTVELFVEQAAGKNIEIATLIELNVTTALQGDPGRLRQILTNVIGNAVKFTEKGEVVVRVSTKNETEQFVVLNFVVSDTGIGISPETQKYLFSAFSQADGSVTRRFGGTGLGLMISKQLVELMKGQIGVESDPGKGSSFWFTIALEKQTKIALKNQSFREDLQNLRLLIVDDNATNRKVISLQTASWGMKTVEAESGQEALKILRNATKENKPFDLVILDYVMPEVNGLELARAIKADPLIAEVRLILMPSIGRRRYSQEANQAGVNGYLLKPIRQSDLFDCIAAVMSREIHQSQPNEEQVVLPTDLVTQYTIDENRLSRRGRILLAEDNKVNQKIAQLQLARLGYQIDVVANGLEAVKATEKQSYSLILMDCHMPEMDGYTATLEIRKREGGLRRTPIIAVTANALQGEREKCLASGMDDYLAKPFNKQELLNIVNSWLSSESSRLTDPSANFPGSSPTLTNADNAKTTIDKGSQTISDGVKKRLDVLEAEVGQEFISTIIEMFLEDTKERLIKLRPLAEQLNFVALEEEAHALKGSSSNIGADTMANLCAQLEERAELNTATEIISLINEIEKAFNLLCTILYTIRK